MENLDLRTMASSALNLLYPRRCAICDAVAPPGELVCGICRNSVRRAGEPACARCGKPLHDERAEYCPDCARKPHLYVQGKAVFRYEGAIRQSMYRFKYSGRREYAAFYAEEAAEQHGVWVRRCGIEVIVPVPMFVGKKRRRGYNQAEVFAKELGERLGIPIDARLVCRCRDTVPQKELDEAGRKRNLKNAFKLRRDNVEYKRVLLVDDIYTTGSTIDAVSEVLLRGGAERIYHICISIGAGC